MIMKLSPNKNLIIVISVITFGLCSNLWAESSSSKDECKMPTTLVPSQISQMTQGLQCAQDKNSLIPHADAIIQVDKAVLDRCYVVQKSDQPNPKGMFGQVHFRKRKDEKNCLSFPETIAVKIGYIPNRECLILEILKKGCCYKNAGNNVAVMNDYGIEFNYLKYIDEIAHSLKLSINETKEKVRQKLKQEYITLIQIGISHGDLSYRNMLIKKGPAQHDFMISFVDFGCSRIEKSKDPAKDNRGNPWKSKK